MVSVVVIGARRRRQGTGGFLARLFHEAGAEVRGVVATTQPSADATAQGLREAHGIACRGYASVEEALERETPDIVVIGSPVEHHQAHLGAAARAGVHCLCEKPMWWDEGRSGPHIAQTEKLVDAFLSRGRILGLVTQWPFTLPAYFTLHDAMRGTAVERFEMHLAPATVGTRMILDSASHPLSLLQALCGFGVVDDARVEFAGCDRETARVAFDYRHAGGTVRAAFRLAHTDAIPRPASYAINGQRVVRTIDPAKYEIYFEADARRVRVEDPLKLLVEDFLRRVTEGEPFDRQGLLESMIHLESLVRAGEDAVGR